MLGEVLESRPWDFEIELGSLGEVFVGFSLFLSVEFQEIVETLMSQLAQHVPRKACKSMVRTGLELL